MAQPTDLHTALGPSLIGSARPDLPPAHLKRDTAKELQLLLPPPRNNSMFLLGAEVFPNSRIPPNAQRAPLLRPLSGDGFRMCPAFLYGPPLPPCVPQKHSMPQPSSLPQASLRRPQSSGLSKLSVKKRVGSAISLSSISSAIFPSRPPAMRRSPKTRLSPSATNQLTLKKRGRCPGSSTDQ